MSRTKILCSSIFFRNIFNKSCKATACSKPPAHSLSLLWTHRPLSWLSAASAAISCHQIKPKSVGQSCDVISMSRHVMHVICCNIISWYIMSWMSCCIVLGGAIVGVSVLLLPNTSFFISPSRLMIIRFYRAHTTQYAWNYSSHCDPSCYYQSKGISHDFSVWARCHARCFQALGRSCPENVPKT